ncbi:MAG: PD-(D/E)XK nuclease-like domain-containing protein [Victivallaceae bacterium]|nr:PD-(D/E)XK nuclease-like domain-containing protein [Victivallaceae bacterium]
MEKYDFIITEPAEEYHAKRDRFLSSHALVDFRKCPEFFHKKETGAIIDEDRPAYVIGRATHTLTLEGMDKFNAEYTVGEPINEKTGKAYGKNTQAYQSWLEAQDKPVISPRDFDFIKRLQIAVHLHNGAAKLLQDGVAEGVVRTEYRGVPCQIRMDFFNSESGIIDLKTCDNLDYFEFDARRFQYLHQAAFYRAVLREASGTAYPFHLIAVEKQEPFRCGVWRISDDALASAESENAAAIERLKHCRAEKLWPTGYEETRLLSFNR